MKKEMGEKDFRKCPNESSRSRARIPLMFSEGVSKGRISVNKFVEITSTNPAKLFGMYPKKGTIQEGSDADLVVIDPNLTKKITVSELHENVDYTSFEGIEVKGYPVMTISRGEIIVEDNKFIGEKGRGKFIKKSTFQILIIL